MLLAKHLFGQVTYHLPELEKAKKSLIQLMKDYTVTMETGRVSNGPVIRKKACVQLILGLLISGKKPLFQEKQGKKLVNIGPVLLEYV